MLNLDWLARSAKDQSWSKKGRENGIDSRK